MRRMHGPIGKQSLLYRGLKYNGLQGAIIENDPMKSTVQQYSPAKMGAPNGKKNIKCGGSARNE